MRILRGTILLGLLVALLPTAVASAGTTYRLQSLTIKQHLVDDYAGFAEEWRKYATPEEQANPNLMVSGAPASNIDWTASFKSTGRVTIPGTPTALSRFSVPLAGRFSWSGTRTFPVPGGREIGTGSCDVAEIGGAIELFRSLPWGKAARSLGKVQAPWMFLDGAGTKLDSCYLPAEGISPCWWFGGCLGEGDIDVQMRGDDRMVLTVSTEDRTEKRQWESTTTFIIDRLDRPGAATQRGAKRKGKRAGRSKRGRAHAGRR